MKDGIYCKNCNHYITSDFQSFDTCGKCGSVEKIGHISIREEIKVEERFMSKWKERDPDSKFKNHIKRELVSGDSFSHSTQEWNKISRVIDRENDLYSEVIKDKDNNIIKSTTVPLTKHTKHGSDKRNNIIEK